MKVENIAIITGGDSSEREVALQTATAVSQSFTRLGIRHDVFDVHNYKHLVDLSFKGYSRVFLALHGGFGENGMAQSLLKGLSIPHNGPTPQASAICMDKRLTKHIAKGLEIEVPEYLFFENPRAVSFEDVKQRLGDRFIVKANNEGCSVGVALIEDSRADFQTSIESAFSYKNGILIERFISGQELSVCYFHGKVLPSFAVGFTTDFFSYEAKFLSEDTKSWLIELEPSLKSELESNCIRIAQVLGLDYYRADIIINNGKPYLIELNTLPGLTSHSLFPKACLEQGISFDQMVLMLNNLGPIELIDT